MLSLLDELITGVLSFCDIIDITCFGLTNKRSQGLCIAFTNKIAPGYLIKIKDKCRSTLYPSFPMNDEQAIRYLPIDYGTIFDLGLDNPLTENRLSNNRLLNGLIISKNKCLRWESIPAACFSMMLCYRSLDEILLFEEKYLLQLLTKREPAFIAPRNGPITRDEFYKRNHYTFSNKRRDVLDYFSQITPVKSRHLFIVQKDPLFIASVINKSTYKKCGEYLGRFISSCSIEDEELVKEQLFLCSDFPEHITNPHHLTIDFSRKNLPLMETVLSFGYKLNDRSLLMKYEDKSLYYKGLNDLFLEDLADFIVKNSYAFPENQVPEQINCSMLSRYLQRFGLEGHIKHRAKLGNNVIDIKTMIKRFKTLTIEDIEYLVLNGFELPQTLPFEEMYESLIPVFTWLYNNGVSLGEPVCLKNVAIKRFLLTIDYKINEYNIFEFLTIDSRQLEPEIDRAKAGLLAKYGPTINDGIISLLIKSKMNFHHKKTILSRILESTNLTVTNKEMLVLIANNTYSQCKLLADSNPGILEYYNKMFFPGIGLC